jgi:hypothetical protein
VLERILGDQERRRQRLRSAELARKLEWLVRGKHGAKTVRTAKPNEEEACQQINGKRLR